MTEAIQSINSIGVPFNMIVWVVLIGASTGMLSTIVTQIRKYASHRQELEFKREMLDRGLGADEIEKIVKARGPGVNSRA